MFHIINLVIFLFFRSKLVLLIVFLNLFTYFKYTEQQNGYKDRSITYSHALHVLKKGEMQEADLNKLVEVKAGEINMINL